jgi:hypothetical protein
MPNNSRQPDPNPPIDVDAVVTKCACNIRGVCLWHYGVTKIKQERLRKAAINGR